MHEPNPRVVEMVDAEVVRDPDATTQELFDLAVLLDEAISSLKLEEFAELYEQPARGGTPTRRKAARKSRKTARKSRKTARKRKSPPAPADPTPAPTPEPTPAPTPAPTVDHRGRRHDAVRREFERFAVDLVSAEADTKRLVAVMADLDRYVARVMEAVES